MKMKSNKQMRFTVVYALCFLILILTTSSVLLYAIHQRTNSDVSSEPEEIYVYLPQEEQEPNDKNINDSFKEENEHYLVKEYEGRIGIFSTEGKLLDVLDTYVKTLPEADRSLLGEGIWVKTKEELNSLIEDYSH